MGNFLHGVGVGCHSDTSKVRVFDTCDSDKDNIIAKYNKFAVTLDGSKLSSKSYLIMESSNSRLLGFLSQVTSQLGKTALFACVATLSLGLFSLCTYDGTGDERGQVG